MSKEDEALLIVQGKYGVQPKRRVEKAKAFLRKVAEGQKKARRRLKERRSNWSAFNEGYEKED